MSLRLRDLIRKVRDCKTAAEERAVIARESSAIRESFRNPSESHLIPRNVAKLMFAHMLGYPSHFGQMECVRLTASPGFPEKRIGYLGLMLLLDENTEVTMLVTNSVKNDLTHKNNYVVGLGLCMLGSICSAEMARDVAGEVIELLGHSNSYVRKKAALTATRVVRKVPELAEDFVEASEKLLGDRHHGVLLAACTLATDMCEMNEEICARMRAQVPMLCKVLKSLIYAGKSAEHDIAGHADPFLQVALLRLLRVLGAGDADASDAMSDILAQIASNTDGSKNAGNAILYEAVETIIAIESIGGLRVLAVNILGRFLQNKDNNIRYVALNTLAKVVAIDTQAIQRHRSVIVDCVKDTDVTIRRSALHLVYSLVNAKNITTLASELLEYLDVCDEEFKPELAKKISALALKFSPSKQWYVDSFITLLVRAGQYIDEFECNDFMGLVARTPLLHGYAGRALYRAACEEDAKVSLCSVATWVCGEYSDAMVHAAPIEDEVLTKVRYNDVVKLMTMLLNNSKYEKLNPLIMTALAKIAVRDPNEAANIAPLLSKYETDMDVETQKRAHEYKATFMQPPELREIVFEHMPPPEAPKFIAADTMETLAQKKTQTATLGGFGDLLNFGGDDQTPSSANASGVDLLNDLLSGETTPASVTPAKAAQAVDLLGEMLGGSVPAASSQPRTSSADALADLMSGADIAVSTTPVAKKTVAAPVDILGDLMSSPVAPSPSAGGADPFMNLAPPIQGSPAAAVAAPSAQVDLLDLMGSASPITSAPQATSTGSLLDLMNDAGTAPAPPAASVPSPPAPPVQVPVYTNGPLSIIFTTSNPNPLDPSETLISAQYVNSGPGVIEQFSLQAAVPKSMTLTMQAASGSTLQPNVPVTQRMTVVNSEHGVKPIAMRLKLGWRDASGQAVDEMATVNRIG